PPLIDRLLECQTPAADDAQDAAWIACAWALGKIAGRAAAGVPVILAAADADPAIARDCSAALRHMHVPKDQGAALLLGMVAGSQITRRGAAARAAYRWGERSPEMIAAARRLSADPDPEVRKWAERIVEEVEESERASTPPQ